MLRNFIKITFRNFLKNKTYVLINLAGLGIALSCCIVAYLNWKFDASHDHNHLNHERIYKIHSYKTVQGEKVAYGIAPMTLGRQIKGKYTGVTHTSRYGAESMVIKKDLNVFDQYVGFAEKDYLEMFTFPLKYGDKKALLDRSNVILSLEAAESYFGKQDPVGEIVTLINDDGEEFPMTVGGVFEKIPMNSSMTFNALTHYDNFLKMEGLKDDDWQYFTAATFVMTDGRYPQNLLDDINQNYIDVQNKARDNFQLSEYYLEQLTHLARNSENIRSNWLDSPPPSTAINVPVVMAVLMLLIACFNFTNTSIAISSKRLKEIGVRKVMGSGRRQLILQFMGENIVLSLGGLLVGLWLADFMVPAYSAMWDFIYLELNLVSDPEIYIFLGLLLLFTSIVAGAYPSIYISKFQPVRILRGSVKLGGSNLFSKVLLGLQYMLTIISLITALAFSNNAKYQANYDVGFEKENIYSISTENMSVHTQFKNEVKKLPIVESAASTTNRIGSWTYSRALKTESQEVDAFMVNFSLEYFDIMGLKMKEGRFFTQDLYEFDKKNSIVINERMAHEFGWEEPIGKVVNIDDTTRLNVIGVIKDFYQEGFFNPVDPMGIRAANEKDVYFLMVKSKENPVEVKKRLEAVWYDLAPNTPFDIEYKDEIAESELVNKNIMILFRFLGFLAFIISTIGLYTLVSLNIIKRVKEIGVRKVLGASIQQIILLLNKQFFWLLLIAVGVGGLASYFLIDLFMGLIFSVYESTTLVTVFAPILLLLFVALSIASARIFSTAIQNPVKSLRYE